MKPLHLIVFWTIVLSTILFFQWIVPFDALLIFPSMILIPIIGLIFNAYALADPFEDNTHQRPNRSKLIVQKQSKLLIITFMLLWSTWIICTQPEALITPAMSLVTSKVIAIVLICLAPIMLISILSTIIMDLTSMRMYHLQVTDHKPYPDDIAQSSPHDKVIRWFRSIFDVYSTFGMNFPATSVLGLIIFTLIVLSMTFSGPLSNILWILAQAVVNEPSAHAWISIFLTALFVLQLTMLFASLIIGTKENSIAFYIRQKAKSLRSETLNVTVFLFLFVIFFIIGMFTPEVLTIGKLKTFGLCCIIIKPMMILIEAAIYSLDSLIGRFFVLIKQIVYWAYFIFTTITAPTYTNKHRHREKLELFLKYSNYCFNKMNENRILKLCQYTFAVTASIVILTLEICRSFMHHLIMLVLDLCLWAIRTFLLKLLGVLIIGSVKIAEITYTFLQSPLIVIKNQYTLIRENPIHSIYIIMGLTSTTASILIPCLLSLPALLGSQISLLLMIISIGCFIQADIIATDVNGDVNRANATSSASSQALEEIKKYDRKISMYSPTKQKSSSSEPRKSQPSCKA